MTLKHQQPSFPIPLKFFTTLPPNHLPLTFSTNTITKFTTTTSTSITKMTPSVSFAHLSDPIKHLDGLDHTSLCWKVFCSPLYSGDISNSISISRYSIKFNVALKTYVTLNCFLTCTASNWYARLTQVYKTDCFSSLHKFK